MRIGRDQILCVFEKNCNDHFMGKSQSVCHYKLIENLIMTVLDFIVCVCVCVCMCMCLM